MEDKPTPKRRLLRSWPVAVFVAASLLATESGCGAEMRERTTDTVHDFPRRLPKVPPGERPLDQHTTWKDDNGEVWSAFKIEVPGRGGSFLYVFQNVAVPSEHTQGIVFAESRKVTPLPYNVGGTIEIDFFLLGNSDDGRPLVRLQDYWGEYLVDLANRKTFNIVRTAGRSFIGEIRGGEPKDGGFSIVGAGSDLKVYIGGGEAREITGLPITVPGKRLGRINSN